MSGKGSNRRREDRAKVEANWPSEWNARESEAERLRVFMDAVTLPDGGVIPFSEPGDPLDDVAVVSHG